MTEAAQHQQRDRAKLALLFMLSLLAAPVEYIAHEGAHYLAARSFGAQATLHYDHVALEGGAQFSPVQRLLFVAAGPAVDWAVGLLALLFLVRRYTPMRLVLAIWVARPLQFLPALLGMDFLYFGRGESVGGTDEAVLAEAIGMSPQALVWLELAVALPLLAIIVLVIPAPRRLIILSVMSVGVLAGWAGWLTWGSYVLP